MSEVQPRGSSTRGRGGFRGGRGGYRGTRGAKSHSASSHMDGQDTTPLEEQGELGELKLKYGDKLPLMREVIPGWSDEDLVFALQETNGDEIEAMERITSGQTSQWGEVKKKAPKTKESAAPSDSSTRGRGRGGLDTRGGRGRGGAERGARVASTARGGRAASQANGTKVTKQAEDSWADQTATATNGDSAAAAATAAADEWATEPGKDQLESLTTTQPKPASSAAPASSNSKGGWAGLFAKPAPPPPPKAETATAKSVPESAPEVPVAAAEETAPIPAPAAVDADEPQKNHLPPPIEPLVVEDAPSELPSAPHSDVAPSDLAPPGDELTKENVNRLPDVSNPVASQTVASTLASGDAPVNPALPPVAAVRPGMSGHAASALRATTGANRSASYSRKVMDQQESLIMPGNHAVDRAAVQFGKMGLDSDDADADEDREEPETRTQLPDDSPAAPRASLPPAPAQAEPQHPAQVAAQAPEPVAEPQAQRPLAGLPSAPQAIQEPSPPQTNAYPDQYSRYAQAQKAGYDPFSHQPHGQTPSEPFSNQLPGQQQSHGLPSVSQQDAYAQYYGREYAQYYAGYNQQHTPGHEQQRSGSAFGTSAPDIQSQYASAGGPRNYGSQDIPSGNNTPNPQMAGHQSQHSSQMQSAPAAHGYPYGGQYGGNYGNAYPQYAGSYGSMNQHNNAAGRYGANRPMFDDVRRQAGASSGGSEDYYPNQYNYGHNQGYSSSYGKSGMYGAPQQYSQQEYSTSPGNAAFTGRDSYGRTGSAQANEGPQSNVGGNSFSSGMQDPFGRTSSGFGQSQHVAHSSEDPAKPTGPSPSLQSGRPGSTTQSIGGQQQHSGMQHSQGNQQAFGYPQYSGFGSQNNQHSAYQGYGSNNAFSGYPAGNYGGRGGWPNPAGYGSGQH